MKRLFAVTALLVSGCVAPSTDYVWEKGLAIETGVYEATFSYDLYSADGNVIQSSTETTVFTISENPNSPAVNINDAWVATNTPDGSGSGLLIISEDEPQLVMNENGIALWWRRVSSGTLTPSAGVLSSGAVTDAYYFYQADSNNPQLPDMIAPTTFGGWDVQRLSGIHRIQPGEQMRDATPLRAAKQRLAETMVRRAR